MSELIVYVDQSDIRDGKFEELKTAMNELVEFVETNEPQLIAYNVYFNEDRTRMTVLHIHSDSASLEFHFNVAGRLFPRFAEFIRLVAIDIYGKPSDDLMEQLNKKAEMLGSGAVLVHDLHAGFARFPIV
jgi:quinol monooxygenase YgiN